MWSEFVETHLERVGLIFSFFNCDLGDGIRVRFWHEVWHGEDAKKDQYPALYLIARD